MVSAGHVGVTRDSGIVSSASDVLWMSVVRGMRGVGGVCEMRMCLARGGVGGEWSEWMRGLSFTNPVGTGGVLDVCLCLGCSGGEWVRGLDHGLEGGVVLCLCESGFFVYIAGPGICILCQADSCASYHPAGPHCRLGKKKS